MSGLEELKRVVERLFREKNVKLSDFIKDVLPEIASHLWEAGLIAKGVKDNAHVSGVHPFEAAAKLLSACQPSLVQCPEEKFPKFIAVLKKFTNMEELAEEVESEFTQARESYNNLVVIRLAGLSQPTCMEA